MGFVEGVDDAIIVLKLSGVTGAMLDAVYLYKLILFSWFHYPVYKKTQIDNIRQKYAPSEKDLHELEFFAQSRWTFWHILVMVIAAAFSLFHCSTSMYLFSANDFVNPANNLEVLDSGEVKFWCLETNCIRIFSSLNESSKLNELDKLASDFFELPFFGLCRPTVRQFAFPATDLGLNGYLFIQAIGLGMFNYCILAQLAQFFSPSGDDTVLFVYAPGLMLKMIRESMRKFYIDLLTSMFIYKANRIRSSLERRLTRLNEANISHDSRFMPFNEKIRDPEDYEKLIKAHYQHGKTSHVEEFLDDCLPLIRTEWWRQRILFSYRKFVTFVIPNGLVGGTIAGLKVISSGIKLREELYKEAAKSMSQQNCHVWLTNDQAKDSRQYIDFNTYKISFGWFPYFQQIYASISNQLVLSSTSLGALISQIELISLIGEIQSQMCVLIELANIYINQFECKDTEQNSYDDVVNIQLASPSHKENYCKFGLENIICSDSDEDDQHRPVDVQLNNHNSEFIKLIEAEKQSTFGRLKSENCHTSGRNKTFKLNHVRELLKKQSANKRWIRPTKSYLNDRLEPYRAKGLNNQIFNQRFALEIYLSDPDNLNTFIELSEKLYIKMKFYLQAREHYSKSLTSMLFYFSLGSYLNAYFTLLYLHRLPDKKLLEQFIMICFAYFAITLLATSNLNHYVSIIEEDKLQRIHCMISSLTESIEFCTESQNDATHVGVDSHDDIIHSYKG